MSAEPAAPAAPARLRLTGPSDLAVCVPYLLGFVPRDSVVVAALDARREVALVARVDLPPAAVPSAWRAAASAIGSEIGAAVLRSGGVCVVPLLYPEGAAPDVVALDDPWREFARRLDEAFDARGIDVLDALVVADGRWWSLVCTEPLCCPHEGTALPPPGTSEAEVRAVAAGLAVLPDRAAVAAALAPVSLARRREVEAAVGRVRSGGLDRGSGVEAVDDALAQFHEPLAALSPEGAAELLVAVDDVLVRDAVSWSGSPEQTAAAVALWSHLVRLAPRRWLPGVAVLLGVAAYQDGAGVLARVALDLVLDVDADHVLANGFAAALSTGVPPREVAAIVRAGAAEARERIGQMP
jgi:hypothetical protein